MRTAAIGIGSNSLRMLVADIEQGKLNRLKRYREGLRMFAALDEQGNIGEDMLANACRSVAGFATEAKAQGAEHIHLFATSAVRDALNQEELAARLLGATGLELEICSGDMEAKLSFYGATDGEYSGLIDIGGGSTELVIGRGCELSAAKSLQMGAVRLYRLHPIQSVADADEVSDMADAILAPSRQMFMNTDRIDWVGVGGTFTTTAAFVQQIPFDQRQSIHGFSIAVADIRAAIERLAPMPYDQRLQLPYLQPQRADIVVHGMAILYACMRSLDIPSIIVSEYGNLEGYLKMKYIL